MKKLFITSISLIFFNLVLSAQNAKIDSLFKLLKSDKDDTSKINHLNALGREFCAINTDTSFLMSNEALELSQKLKWKTGIGLSYHTIAYTHYNNGDFSLALKYYSNAIEIWNLLERNSPDNEKSSNQNNKAKSLGSIGTVYQSLGDHRNALDMYISALRMSEKLGNKNLIAGWLSNIGSIYYEQANYPKALKFYLNGLKIYEELNSRNLIASVMNNIGAIYREQFEYSKALELFLKAMEIRKELGDNRGVAYIFNNIGSIYNDQDENNKALDYYFKALKINQELKSKKYISLNLGNIGIVYFKQKKYQMALSFYFNALKIDQESGNTNGIAKKFQNIGILYATINNFPEAEKYLIKALSLSKSINDLYSIMDINKEISALYTKTGKYSKALDYYKNFIIAKDSIFNEEKAKEITRTEMNYDFDKKEAVIKAETDKKEALAKAEIGKQKVIRNSIAGGTGIILLSAAFSFLFYKRKREATFKNEVSEVEMKALRAQMNPHFIFNSLNSINSYLEKNDNKTASHYLLDFASVMRMILENSEQKEVTLQEDLKALELYMKLESMRMTRKFDYEIKVDENIDAENTMIPPLILQPFVENSIWHGLASKKEAGKIIINITKNGDMMECSVEDNGIGREKSGTIKAQYAIPGKKSLGMKITKARIDIINKIKKSNAGVELIDLAEGMRVVVRLPLELGF